MLWLGLGEKVEADDGCMGEDLFVGTPEWWEFRPKEKMEAARARSRHETMNSRLKDWRILGARFRHTLWRHGNVLRSIAVINQLGHKHGGMSLFDCTEHEGFA